MTKAELTYLNATDEDINSLPVSYAYFAEFASLYGRAYGVVTGEERGITGPDDEQLEGFVANNCVRRALYQGLLRVSEAAEQQIGYKLGTRYQTVQPKGWRGSGKIILIPGLEAVEVDRNWYEIPAGNTFDLNYYAQENLTLFLDGSTVIARVDSSLFENPTHAYLKNITQGNKKLVVDKTHSRYAELDTGDWLLPLTTNVAAVAVTDTVHAFHQRYIWATVTKPDVSSLPTNGSIKPVYPGTNQIVEHTVISEDDTTVTYRFPVWVLVHPAFADEADAIQWQAFPTYKFYPSLELRYVVEEAAYLELVWTEGDDQYTYQYDPDDPDAATLPRLEAVIVDAETGIVHLYANDYLVQDLTPYWYCACSCRRTKMPEHITVRIPVKVTVAALGNRHRGQVDRIREAVIAKVAAELPVEDCGCKNKVGYIKHQQDPYGNNYVNPFTGVEVVKTDYGNRHGQKTYDKVMEEVLIFRKPLRVGR